MDADTALNAASPLFARAAAGDMEAWGALLVQHEERLRAVVAFRLDPRLRGRVEPVDVMQETLMSATERRADFFRQSEQPLFLWLRWMVGNTLLELHRHHLGVQMRDARRELSSARASGAASDDADATREALAAHLTCGVTGPATAAGRAELHARLKEALNQMDPTDRVEKHPEFADRIRKILAAVAMIEQTRPVDFSFAGEGPAGATPPASAASRGGRSIPSW